MSAVQNISGAMHKKCIKNILMGLTFPSSWMRCCPWGILRNLFGMYQKQTLTISGSSMRWNLSFISFIFSTKYSAISIRWSMCFSKPNSPWKLTEVETRSSMSVFGFFFRHPGTYLCPKLDPELEDVVVSSALYDFVSRVVLDIVKFVLHEQVVSRHLVAT